MHRTEDSLRNDLFGDDLFGNDLFGNCTGRVEASLRRVTPPAGTKDSLDLPRPAGILPDHAGGSPEITPDAFPISPTPQNH